VTAASLRAARAIALLGVAALLAGASGSDTPSPRRAIREQRVELDGATIRALCTDGARRVVLLHGDGADADTWRPVLERLDGSVGACAYDRRGTGESVPEPERRGWFELVDEMRRIHLALGFDRGYVVVGHDIGGLYARVFAADRPTDVAGLVLVDPSHEDMLTRRQAGMPRSAWDAAVAARSATNADGVTERAVGDRARAARLPDIPVTVITAALRRDGDGWDARFLNEAARQAHESILRGATFGRHIPAAHSTHEVQRDEPGLVADEILRVVRASGR
jgi:pimeloyl-ACP methyl ester carboxylesterase